MTSNTNTPGQSPKITTGTTKHVNKTTGDTSEHSFQDEISDKKVKRTLHSLKVPSITTSAESMSPGAIEYQRALAKALYDMKFREQKALGVFAVPKPGKGASGQSKATMAKQPDPIVCPDCDGWGVMEEEETEKLITCPRCHGAKWIQPS